VRRFARDLDLLSVLRDVEPVVLADGGPFGIDDVGLSEIRGFGGEGLSMAQQLYGAESTAQLAEASRAG
jgi:hypothetical protein